MVLAAEDACECDGRGVPPTFCEDDLFCPQCGVWVADLGSARNLVNAEEATAPDGSTEALWLYPEESSAGSPVFGFTLTFKTRTPRRKLEIRRLELISAACGGALRDFFEEKLQGTRNPVRDEEVNLQLQPRAGLRQGWHHNLPDGGIRGTIEFQGDCGRRVMAVRAFNDPRWNVKVEGTGVVRDPGWVNSVGSWKLSKRESLDEQDLTIEMAPTNAWVYLPALNPDQFPAPRFLEAQPIKIIETPASAVVLSHKEPAVYVLEIDTTSWTEEQDALLIVTLPLAAVGPTSFLQKQLVAKRIDPTDWLAEIASTSFPLKLARKKLGDLVFDCGDLYPIDDTLFYGEKFDSQSRSSTSVFPPICLRNDGYDAVSVSRPVITYQSRPGGVEWLTVIWGKGDEDTDTVRKELPSGGKIPVRLLVDLTSLTPENHPPGSPLTATIEARDINNNLTRTLTVRIAKVGRRRPLEVPLAVDFGNTNTLAAVVENGRIKPVLGLADDPFPSALFATEVEVEDRVVIQFLAGPQAMDLGKKDPARLIRGLKRELSIANDGDPPQYVFGIANSREEARFTYSELIGQYLERVIDECQTRLRKTVQRVGLSYPANFGAKSRARLESVLRLVETRRAVRFEPLTTDEATAVALSFVLDVKVLTEAILRRTSGDGGDHNRPFLVASFDFGGGSIDCALIRFRLRGSLDEPNYEAHPLGIGGDEFFGGDHVTIAVTELLEDRVRAVLGAARGAAKVDLPMARAGQRRHQVSKIQWENFHHLWEASEGVKRFACQPDPTDDDREQVKEKLDALRLGLRVEPQGQPLSRKLTESAPLDQAFQQALKEGRLLIGLDQIYGHKIRHDPGGEPSSLTVRDRVEKCVAQLKEYLNRSATPAPTAPDFVVMAGAGCHLPLARELLTRDFGSAELLFDLPHAKSKVAFGLSHYLDHRLFNEDRVKEVRPASDFSHADLVWRRGMLGPLVLWVPSCSPLREREPTWYGLPGRVLSQIWTGERQILVLRNRAPEPEVIGHFDLKGPTQPGEAGFDPDFPADLPVSFDDGGHVAVRFLGAEDVLLLRIENLAGRSYGDWKLIPGPPAPRADSS